MSEPQPSPTATIRCLGAFEVLVGQTTITGFPTDKIRALLAYLALETAQPHRRELVAGLLWPGMPGPAPAAPDAGGNCPRLAPINCS